MSESAYPVCALPGIGCRACDLTASASAQVAGPAGFLTWLLDTAGFPRRWNCGAWPAGLGWLHVISDVAIFAAYLSIPLALAYFLARRRDLPFPRLIALFGTFILSCGVGHAIEALIFWHPVYRLAGVVKAVTAIVSWATVVVTVRILPDALKLPGIARLNQQLLEEMDERRRAEEALRRLNDGLEIRVRERTAELEGANATLVATVNEQRRAEAALLESEERFRGAFDAAAIGMALVAPDGRWLQVNRSLCEIVGYSEEELTATTFQAIAHPDELPADLDRLRRVLAAESHSYQTEKRCLHRTGRVVWVHLSVSLVRDADDRPVHFVMQLWDITSRKEAEQSVAERARLAELSSEIGVALTQCAPLAELLQRCAESLARHLSAAVARIWTLEQPGDVLQLRASAGVRAYLDGGQNRVPVGDPRIGQIVRERRPYLTTGEGGDSPLSEDGSPARGDALPLAGYPLLVDDLLMGVMAVSVHWPLSEHALQALESVANGIALAIERKRAEAMLAHQATHDGLTGLPNRSLLLRNIESWIFSARGVEARCALLLLDLDRFKEINDTFGHHYGDEILKQLSPRLLRAVRAPDPVARLGGDEFGILLTGADEQRALQVADRVLGSLEQPITVNGRSFEVGASIGIVLSPDHGTDATTLLQRADVAMYVAKRGRRGRVVYSPNLSDCTPRRLELTGELRHAIETNQLLLHYQPKVDLGTMRVDGVEALVRWLHPRDGLIPPGQFIPLAEETGLIRPLGLWSLNAALRQCRAWHDAGLDLNVAVNLSPENIHDEQLTAVFLELLKSPGALPRRLTVEVTETAMMRQPARAKKVLEWLHEMGVRISIDDFGTGYSSLAFLKELPVDEVKVDRSFVRDMMYNDRDSSIVRAVIDLGHDLDLKVVAEGVEDDAIAEQLAAWGCDLAQGYYFSRPLAAPDFVAWMVESARSAGSPMRHQAPREDPASPPRGPHSRGEPRSAPSPAR